VTAALQVEKLNRAFGALPVTRDVDLTLERGARRALIGPNGAGKTTLVNLITGVLKPHSGRVLLNGEDITASSQAARARRGLARTFQINQLFRGLTVLENLCMTVGERDGHCDNLWRSAGSKREVIDDGPHVQRGSADHYRDHVAGLTVGNGGSCKLLELRNCPALVDSQQVDHVMADFGTLGGGGLGCANVHTAIDQHRVCVDDLSLLSFRRVTTNQVGRKA